ncbi:MAG: HlyD family type I secretion periplasmic adaptor subunit [Proteobacteria bacterium]|nr:HlyD family type I secretion periplasmic adaptor subunit [Pseudomonadota bacterium]
MIGGAAGKPAPDGWGAGGYIRFGIFCVALLAGGLGGWAATAKLKGAVISSGHLRVESQRQVVQHLDGGIVGEILVREGDLVAAGEVLIRLDGTTLRSELAVLESQLYELMARRGRLTAEQTDSESIAFDAELLAAAGTNPEVRALADGQQLLFEARLRTMAREIEVMRERQVQIREQITGSVAEIGSLERQSELIAEELVGQRTLLAKGLAKASQVLALDREAARLEGQRGQVVARAAQLKGQISELEIELLRLGAARREEAITKLRDLGFKELELKERRIALSERLSRLAVRAPLAGVVLDMTVFALKSVVRAAEPMLYIVPSDSALVVDARIDPIDIDSVRAGQDAVLRFSAFNTRTTPELFGIVSKVSPDAFIDETTKRSYYRAEVLLKEGELLKLDGQELVAGMPVEVFIQTGERTPINYLLKPITDYFNRAMREE